MSCQTYHGEDICPTADELIPQYMAMLPRGRAWGEGGPGREPGGIIWGYFYALAIVIAAAHHAICARLAEFFCSTASVTLPWWNEQYGLDDGCDPFPDLCAKVAAIGGVSCAYYEALAAMAGFNVICGLVNPPKQPSAGCGYVGSLSAICGFSQAGGSVGGVYITVLVPAPTVAAPAPPALSTLPQPFTGRLLAGQALNCVPGVTSVAPPAPHITPPDITGLVCLLTRVAPAHAPLYIDFGVAL